MTSADFLIFKGGMKQNSNFPTSIIIIITIIIIIIIIISYQSQTMLYSIYKFTYTTKHNKIHE